MPRTTPSPVVSAHAAATCTAPSPQIELTLGECEVVQVGGGRLAQVHSGWCLLDAPGADPATASTWLAGPGDWLGAEWQEGAPVSIQVTPLAPCVLSVQPWHSAAPHSTLLVQALRQHKQRAADLIALRSGQAEQRLRHLLTLLSDASPRHWPTTTELPALKDIAKLVDLAPETACRALARLRAQAAPSATTSQASPPAKPSSRATAKRWVMAPLLAATWALASPAMAADTTPAAQLQRWNTEAQAPGDAAKGQVFFSTTHGNEWSCSSCHNAPPTTEGKHANTGKVIAPMAPAFNPNRFTDTAKADKWFRRNCKDVLSRECSASEKAHVLAYLLSLKR
jgi:hypothetical protein